MKKKKKIEAQLNSSYEHIVSSKTTVATQSEGGLPYPEWDIQNSRITKEDTRKE